jgi:D-3-phosphoglycerate dehydrogenase
MPKTILVTATNYSALCLEAKALLEGAGCRVIENEHGRPLTFEEIKPLAPEIDAVVAGVDTWNEAIFAIAPRLKAIARFGVGVDNIDVAAANRHGITVTNCRNVNSNSVAEQTMALILSAVRRVPELQASTKLGKWERAIFTELRDMTLGLIGFGSIGASVAKKAKAFDMRVIAYDPFPNAALAESLGVELLPLEAVLSASDVLSLHLPSTAETRHFINADSLARVKKGAYVVNTARGALIDETALLEALRSGHLAGAAVDVYESEPVDPKSPLFQESRFIGTPHVAAESYRVYSECGLMTARAILDVFDGKTPVNKLG